MAKTTMATKTKTKTKTAIKREKRDARISTSEREQVRPQAKTAEEKALALTSEGIFRAFEKAIPKGATTVNVLNAAATLIGTSLVQMGGTKKDLHAVFMRLEEWVLKKVEVKDGDNKNKK